MNYIQRCVLQHNWYLGNRLIRSIYLVFKLGYSSIVCNITRNRRFSEEHWIVGTCHGFSCLQSSPCIRKLWTFVVLVAFSPSGYGNDFSHDTIWKYRLQDDVKRESGTSPAQICFYTSMIGVCPYRIFISEEENLLKPSCIQSIAGARVNSKAVLGNWVYVERWSGQLFVQPVSETETCSLYEHKWFIHCTCQWNELGIFCVNELRII